MLLLLFTTLFCLSFANHLRPYFTKKYLFHSKNYRVIAKTHSHHHSINVEDVSCDNYHSVNSDILPSNPQHNQFISENLNNHLNYKNQQKNHFIKDDSDYLDSNHYPLTLNKHLSDLNIYSDNLIHEDYSEGEKLKDSNEYMETICKYMSFATCTGCQLLPICEFTENQICGYSISKVYFDNDGNSLLGICETDDISYYFVVTGMIGFWLIILHGKTSKIKQPKVKMHSCYEPIQQHLSCLKSNELPTSIKITIQHLTYTPPIYVA
ncbi:hypothetical protein QTN25_005543 [Entamoeba marina]